MWDLSPSCAGVYDPRFDLNDPPDGLIDYLDLLLFMEHFGTQGSPNPTWTPTPTPTATPPSEITIDLPNLAVGAKPLVLVRIPAGSFLMGRYTGELDSYDDEDPQHQVNIDYSFYIGKYEITKAQWQAVVGTTPWSGYSYVHPDSPAVFVYWSDIPGPSGFLDRLNAVGQGTFRLPSEAEWEYACRAGTPTRFYWGDDTSPFSYTEIDDYAWQERNTGAAPPERYAHVVGLKLPNAWGLYDMSGNVWEWCEDDWHSRYSPGGRPDDGRAWIDSPRGTDRVLRGGSWDDFAGDCRSGTRSYLSFYGTANPRFASVGLRVVRTDGGAVPTPTPTPPATPAVTPLPEITVNLPGLPQGAVPLILVAIPAGSFMMGRYAGELDSYGDEDPQHPVTIGYSLYMGKYELTKAQWQAVTGTTPWVGQSYVLNDPDSPAIYVSWNDIVGAGGFLEKLNALGQGTFRLPSEAEWEYACRATTTTRFYWSDDPSYSQIGNNAWYDGNAVGAEYAHVVGRKAPNWWGLYDMSGNVWEWCQDWYHSTYNNAPSDGTAWESPTSSVRVIRGGGFNYSAVFCRSAARLDTYPGSRRNDGGLRVVRNP